MKYLITLSLFAVVLAGCSNQQDVGDANKPMPKGNTTLPPAPAAAGGGPASPTQQTAQ